MQKMPPALQVSPDCVSVPVLPWPRLQCWAGSRSRQCFSWGETPQAAALPPMWQLICHLGWPLSQAFLAWLFCAVLGSGPQRAVETCTEGDLIREKLCCESMKSYKIWRYHKTQLRGFPVWISKTRGTERSRCACPASPWACPWPKTLCQPSPWLSVPAPALWPQGSSQPLLLPKENRSRDLTFQLSFFSFIHVLHIQLRE